MKKQALILLLTVAILPAAWLRAAPGDGGSINIGANTLEADSNSGAFGSWNRASGVSNSVVVGEGNGGEIGVVNASSSIVVGMFNFYDADYAYANEYSAIIGMGNSPVSDYNSEGYVSQTSSSLVVGNSNATSISCGLVAGSNNFALGQAFLLGNGLIANGGGPVVIVGEYNEATPPAGKTFRFVIGNGGYDSPRRNAFEVYTNGEAAFRAPVKLFNGVATTPGIVLDPVTPQITIGGQPVLTATSTSASIFTAPSFGFNSGSTSRLAIDASGNVGIGLASPGFRLDVAGTNTVARIASEAGWTGAGTAALVLGKTSSAGRLGFAGSSGSVLSTYGFSGASDTTEIRASHLGAGGFFSWYTTSGTTAERMRIGNNGNVGIGTTAPPAKLSVQGSGTGSGLTALFTDANITSATQVAILDNGRVGVGTSTPNTVFHIVRSTNTAPVTLKVQNTAAASSNAGAELLLGTSTNVATDSVGASILASRTDAATAGDTDLVLRNSAGPTMTERMRIKANGNVGIGTSSPQATLDVNGSAKISGAVTMSGTVTMPRQGDLRMGRFGNPIDQ